MNSSWQVIEVSPGKYTVGAFTSDGGYSMLAWDVSEEELAALLGTCKAALDKSGRKQEAKCTAS